MFINGIPDQLEKVINSVKATLLSVEDYLVWYNILRNLSGLKLKEHGVRLPAISWYMRTRV